MITTIQFSSEKNGDNNYREEEQESINIEAESTEESGCKAERPYSLYTIQDCEKFLKEKLQCLKDEFGLLTKEAVEMLRMYNCDVELCNKKLLLDYSYRAAPVKADIQGKGECGSCGFTFPQIKGIKFSCHHSLCIQCINLHFFFRLSKQATYPEFTKCPVVGCTNGEADEEDFIHLFSDERCSYLKKYNTLKYSHIMEACKSFKKCRNTSCDIICSISRSSLETNPVDIICHCGDKFCSNCHGNVHAPVPCQQSLTWNQLEIKSQQILDPSIFEACNLRLCPTCDTVIPKYIAIEINDAGTIQCGHCHTYFCWKCMNLGVFHKAADCSLKNWNYCKGNYKEEWSNYLQNSKIVNTASQSKGKSMKILAVFEYYNEQFNLRNVCSNNEIKAILNQLEDLQSFYVESLKINYFVDKELQSGLLEISQQCMETYLAEAMNKLESFQTEIRKYVYGGYEQETLINLKRKFKELESFIKILEKYQTTLKAHIQDSVFSPETRFTVLLQEDLEVIDQLIIIAAN
jgi:hypothetical protein